MSKHHRAFKLELAKRAENESSRHLSRQCHVSSRQIRYWSLVYRFHGANSFLHLERPYTLNFKIGALMTMRENDWSIGYTSAYFDLSSPSLLSNWQKLYSLGSISNLRPKQKGRRRMKRDSSKPKPSEQMTEKELREELDYLRAENAVLKKLEALAQAKKKQTKKRP